jgi:hypothetical protein
MPTFWRWPCAGTRSGGIGSPGRRPCSVRPMFASVHGAANFSIAGIARDATGTPLPGATVKLYRTGTDAVLGTTIADGSGAFSFVIGDNAGNFYATAFAYGATPVAGITLDTLTAVQA